MRQAVGIVSGTNRGPFLLCTSFCVRPMIERLRSFCCAITRNSHLSMQPSPLYAVGVIAASIMSCSATVVFALPLTPFRYETQAQRHCPADTVVWLDFRKGIYYSKGRRQYAQGFNGAFVCRDEARRSRYRRSLLGLR
jgi:hypothetical protein